MGPGCSCALGRILGRVGVLPEGVARGWPTLQGLVLDALDPCRWPLLIYAGDSVEGALYAPSYRSLLCEPISGWGWYPVAECILDPCRCPLLVYGGENVEEALYVPSYSSLLCESTSRLGWYRVAECILAQGFRFAPWT